MYDRLQSLGNLDSATTQFARWMMAMIISLPPDRFILKFQPDVPVVFLFFIYIRVLALCTYSCSVDSWLCFHFCLKNFLFISDFLPLFPEFSFYLDSTINTLIPLTRFLSQAMSLVFSMQVLISTPKLSEFFGF